MKLSNKILIGFLGFVLLYMIAAFTELRLRGDNVRFDSENVIIETIPLSNITYLNISDLERNISVSSSSNPRIEIRSVKGKLLPSLKYEIQGDTLNITGLKINKPGSYQLTIFVPAKEFSGIELTNSYLIIKDINLPALSINQSGGNVIIENNVYIEELTVQAVENAHLNAMNVRINILSVQLNSSTFIIQSRMQKFEGSISNGSMVLLSGPGEMALKKDETSTINWGETNN